MIYSIENINSFSLDIKSWYKIFLYWDLWAGKTTIIKNILVNMYWINYNITSPTYIHYKKYLSNIYHFDLYRLESYNDFINIWGEEILECISNICFIEWPEIIEWIFTPDIRINIKKIIDNEDIRDIEIIYKNI